MAVDVDIDVALLKSEIKKTYSSVSEEPEREFIFPTGRAWAAEAKIAVADDERLSPHSLRHTYTSRLIVGLELDAVTTSKLAGHADPNVTMRVYADDFRKASERNAAVLARAAERGFGR